MQFTSRAAGRVCLFGDHQDYLGLPIIACAIDRYATISGTPNKSDVLHIEMPDIDKVFDLRFRKNSPTPYTTHLINAIEVVRKYGCEPKVGYNLTIKSNIPINAGLSSSSAVVVAWVQWLLHTFGCNQKITPKLIGQLGYEAEVIKSNSSGGKMDQYTSAIGGTIYLETNTQSNSIELDNSLSTLIVAESGIPKDTEGLLGDLKKLQLDAIHKVQKSYTDFELPTATLLDYENYKNLLKKDEQRYLFAAIQNHLITQRALVCFRESVLDLKTIGKLMNSHHEVLRNALKITVPKIDQMIEAALNSGAHGAKIVGSGGGGSICAIAPQGREDEIVATLMKAGACDAYLVKTGLGAHIL